MRDVTSYPSCFDPYLRYAISTGFRNFQFFDERHHKLFFLVEFKPADPAKRTNPETLFEQAMEAAGVTDIQFGPENDTAYRTLQTSISAVLKRATFRIWDKYFSRVELSLPLLPSPIPERRSRKPAVRRHSRGSLLIGVLDDGCPFAATQFLKNPVNAPASTRVLAIWDQNQGKAPVQLGGGDRFGHTLLYFNYGLEYRRETGGSQIGLDDWMQRHLTPSGTIDEDHCYADADFISLRFRESHGAPVTDIVAGHIPTSSRIGPTKPGHDHRNPPSWHVGTDPASHVDVVFVQFPESGILDATGVWLKAYVLDGIQYILSCAGPHTRHVIINLSYGPTTGPHDGTAALEQALSALVAHYNGITHKPKLEIFLAAGNSYLTDGHVAYTRGNGQPRDIEWTWRLLPDNPVLCFSEIWMTSAQASGVTVTLTPPGGAPVPIHPVLWGTNKMWLLNVDPTLVVPGVHPAPHGDYTIRVRGIAYGAKVDAYVARTDPNLGVISQAKHSYFVDPKWEQTRSASADCIYAHGEFDISGSLISRYGTLNGIATAKVARVHVAGGDMLAEPKGRKSPYASAGPARGVPATTSTSGPGRIGPDFALYCDESYALEGVRAGGTRSGVVFRLVGTSAAAPQLARLAANPPLPGPTDIPSTPEGREQRGKGNIEPP
jgi:hypothetical protein